jgi:hypothetical protein
MGALTGGQALDYALPGLQPATLQADGGADTIEQFLQACKSYADALGTGGDGHEAAVPSSPADSCCCGQPLDGIGLVIAENHAGADEADAAHDALDHALHHAAHGVWVSGEEVDADRRQRHDSGAERDETERAHADRLAGEVTIGADEDAHSHRGTHA